MISEARRVSNYIKMKMQLHIDRANLRDIMTSEENRRMEEGDSEVSMEENEADVVDLPVNEGLDPREKLLTLVVKPHGFKKPTIKAVESQLLKVWQWTDGVNIMPTRGLMPEIISQQNIKVAASKAGEEPITIGFLPGQDQGSCSYEDPWPRYDENEKASIPPQKVRPIPQEWDEQAWNVSDRRKPTSEMEHVNDAKTEAGKFKVYCIISKKIEVKMKISESGKTLEGRSEEEELQEDVCEKKSTTGVNVEQSLGNAKGKSWRRKNVAVTQGILGQKEDMDLLPQKIWATERVWSQSGIGPKSGPGKITYGLGFGKSVQSTLVSHPLLAKAKKRKLQLVIDGSNENQFSYTTYRHRMIGELEVILHVIMTEASSSSTYFDKNMAEESGLIMPPLSP